jgi:uncharacterized protein (TIGR00661 family)
MKFFFIVQGEGRGHMTQAIALEDMLLSSGHQVVQVLVGKSERRKIPSFFYEKIKAPIETFESPNFVTDKKNKSINIPQTLWHNLKKQKVFFANMKKIDNYVKSSTPDVIVNFYDLLGGLYYGLYKPKIKFVTVGHQYFLQHPKFQYPKGRYIERFLVNLNTNLTSWGAHKKLALSFREEPDFKNIHVVPPLLRKEILEVIPVQGDYLLGYTVNHGYGEDVLAWHAKNRDIKIHFFWDNPQIEVEYSPHPNITFHQLDDKKFIEKMKNCKGYISSAGFESICEAMYLGKPVMMIPTEGQFEQECNALDAVKSGAGISSTAFDLDKFLDYLPKHKNPNENFKKWIAKSKELFLKHLTEW